jgi:hypothetical protein
MDLKNLSTHSNIPIALGEVRCVPLAGANLKISSKLLEDILKNSNVTRWKNITTTSNSLTVLAKLWATTFVSLLLCQSQPDKSNIKRDIITTVLRPINMTNNV